MESPSAGNKFLKLFQWLYVFACISFAVMACVWCIWIYLMDEDVSHVTFQYFNEDDDSRYPSVTLCFTFPFLEHKLKMIGGNITGDLYQNFLKGEYWDENMMSIEYDNVTLNLDEYINNISVFEESWNGTITVSFRSYE